MEFIPDNEEKILPTGVKVVGIIQFVVSAIAIFSTLGAIAMYSTLERANATTGVELPGKGMFVISLVILLAIVASIIGIFLKNKIGVFAYIGLEAVNLILGIVLSGVTIYLPLGLILPGLMIFFIFKQKEIFGL